MEKLCPVCKTWFQCSETIDCWCNRRFIWKNDEERRDESIKRLCALGKYNGCVCPACLDNVLVPDSHYESKLVDSRIYPVLHQL